MKRSITSITLIASLLFSAPVLCATPVDDLGSCLVDSLNGKERKELAKWIFFAIAAHPDIKSYSRVNDKDSKESDEFVGKLVTRLLTDNCPTEFQKANKSDPLALRKSFGLVGKVAMQELMEDQDVMKSITNYVQYVDQGKINKVLAGK